MSALTLALASRIVDEALVKGRELAVAPLTVAALDPGGHLIALKREDGAGILRVEIAVGKAWGALGLGAPSRRVAKLAEDRPQFAAALAVLASGRVVPAAGGILIRARDGRIIGAIGISGDSSENDEQCAIHAVRTSGLIPDPPE